MLVFILLSTLSLKLCQGSEMEVELVDVVLEDINYYYIGNETQVTINDEDDGPTSVSLQLELLRPLPAETELFTNILAYSMGEYKQSVGIEVESLLCDMYDDPNIFGPIIEALEFEVCPPEKGTYVLDHYIPATDSMPDVFPDGKYRMFIQLKYNDEPLVSMMIYAEIQ